MRLTVLYVHRAERADRLADELAKLLREGFTDPFAAEVVAVPARGVERWLTQRLSHVLGASTGERDGVCANIRFTSPTQLVNESIATATATLPAEDPWQPRRIVWPLLELLTECAAEPWSTAPIRRFSSAQHLAGLYESYGAQRPAMIRSWAEGVDVDGAGAALSTDLRWQADLWRRLRDRI
ncbi:MAG: exodeoxyribonuclease V subunit gamma, partial [Frankiaceae bacterium]